MCGDGNSDRHQLQYKQVEMDLEHNTEIDASALMDLCVVIEELQQLACDPNADAGRIHRTFIVLKARFEDLTAAAEALSRRLEQAMHSQPSQLRPLIDNTEQFVAGLAIATDRVRAASQEIDPGRLARLLHAISERTIGDSSDEASARREAVCSRWHSVWDLFSRWFISSPDEPSRADLLRARARTALPALLSSITSTLDQRRRIDRSNDLRTLARWFAEADSEADAHRLWRALFGLSPARHLMVNDATLDDYEAEAIAADASWFDAPPLRIPAYVPSSAARSDAGAMNRLIDRTAEKERLASATREEVARILNARFRFGGGERLRLSNLEELEPAQFDLLLDLLGEAMAARASPLEPVEILSGDGCLRIQLEPTRDDRHAWIATSHGIFSGPDHWITIEAVSDEEGLEVMA
jgi:uncharacterized protein (TIGR02677 family)